MTRILSCMGGWCAQREHCPHYHAGQPGTVPDERICEPGKDGQARWMSVIPPEPEQHSENWTATPASPARAFATEVA